jgi:hypothetical protein
MFTVRSIDMNPCANVTKEEVWSIVRGVGKRNIWAVPAGEVSRRLASHPWVRTVSVRKSFPDRLVVRIGEQRPVAMVNLDALWYVSDEGKPFKRLTAYDPKDLAIITGFSVGDLRAKDAVTARNFRKSLDLLRLAEAGPLRKNLSEVHLRRPGGVHARDPGHRRPVQDRRDGFPEGDTAGGGGAAEGVGPWQVSGHRRPQDGGPHLRAAGGMNGHGA